MLGWIFGGLVKKLERSARSVSQDFVRSAGKELNHLFDEKLYPLADKLDYIAQQRIKQSKIEIEELENKTKTDIEFLLNNAQGQAKQVIEEINQVREATIKDIRETLGQADAYLENRINQVSLAVMEALNFTELATQKTLGQITYLEEKLFQDANQLVEKLDEILTGKLEEIRLELKKYLVHALPSPLDKCRRRLKIGLKPGPLLSDWEVYELSQCYELSKLDENTPIRQVLAIYGQLQLNAARMAVLVKNAPELKQRAVQDWVKYGVLCEFWNDTTNIYESVTPFVLEPQSTQRLLTNFEDSNNLEA